MIKECSIRFYGVLLCCIVLLRFAEGGMGENKETTNTAKNGTLHNV